MHYKRSFLTFIFLATAICTLSSCATSANYNKQLNYWIGKSERQLIMGWGVPDKQFQLNAHTLILSYINRRTVSYPGTFSSCVGHYGEPVDFGTCGGIPPSVVSYSCETMFIIVKGRVTRWGHKGNDCVD